MRLLIVEDAEDLADAIADRMAASGHVCDKAATLADARQLLALQPFDLAVVDINLPDGTGLTLLREMRSAKNRLPVLVLTARWASTTASPRSTPAPTTIWSSRSTSVNWKRASAPSFAAAMARPIRCWKRAISASTLLTRQVTVDGQPCDLTRREQSLLEILLSARGRVIAKEELHSRLFGSRRGCRHQRGRTLCRAPSQEARQLRLRRIRTLRGLGYQAV